MANYSQEKLDEINESADIVELVSNYVALKRAGSIYKGLCPFHSEKTPSFVVTPQRRMFHCFGCGVGGGAIRFLMMISGRSFPEAVEELAQRYGVELPQDGPDDYSRPVSRETRTALYEALKKARDYFVANLWSSDGLAARRYLAGRGLTEAVVREFGLGCSRPGWDGLLKHLRAEGFSDKIMAEAGLIKPGRQPGDYYDVFRDRLMVPIVDAEGRVAAFGGRLMSEAENQPKYLNSPETPVYKKGRLLFGFRRARPYLRAAGLVFLVEGYFDLISMVAGGINEVVAPLGTALTSQQVNLLRGQVTRLMLLFDGDEAGQRAAAKTLPILLNAELDGRVMILPKGQDPDSFIREFGSEALFEAAGQAVDLVDFVAGRLKNAFPDSLSGQARMLRAAKEMLAQVPDQGKRWLLAKRLAPLLNIEEALLGAGGSAKPRQLRHEEKAPAKSVTYDLAAGELLTHILVHPETAGRVLTEMAAWWPQDASLPLFRRLKELYEIKGDIAPEDAVSDYSDEIAALVSAAALSPRQHSPEESGQVAEELMGRLKKKYAKKRAGELVAAVKKAQASQNEGEVASLMAELKSLQDSQKSL